MRPSKGEMFGLAQLENRAKDGSIYWVETTVAPIHTVAGELEEIISIRTDVTAIKSQEEDVALAAQMQQIHHRNLSGRDHCL